MAPHILQNFDEALNAIRSNALLMATLTERNLSNAMQALFLRDDDLCTRAIADDEEVDQLEKQIDKDGVECLMRFQPVASDLRRVVSALKLNSNLERIADQATSIGRRVRKLNQHPALEQADLLRPMYDHALGMLKDSLDAFVREDAERARAVIPRDKTLDRMNKETSRLLITLMGDDPAQLRGYLNLMFISRCLERVGDHATNIAEDAVYTAAAEDIRHQTIPGTAEGG